MEQVAGARSLFAVLGRLLGDFIGDVVGQGAIGAAPQHVGEHLLVLLRDGCRVARERLAACIVGDYRFGNVTEAALEVVHSQFVELGV